MKRLILSLFLALPLAAVAQNVHFKLGGGLSSHYGSAESVGAYKIGIGYEWELGQKWAISPGIEFYGKGWKDPDVLQLAYDTNGDPVVNDAGEQMYATVNRTATQYYLQVPILASYFLRTGEARYVIFSAGPYFAYGVGGKQKTKGDTQFTGVERYYYETKTFDQSGTHRFDCGIQAFAGYQFANGFTIGLEADFGLCKFNSAGDRNISGLISLGYKLK